jgi:hypothetical protein
MLTMLVMLGVMALGLALAPGEGDGTETPGGVPGGAGGADAKPPEDAGKGGADDAGGNKAADVKLFSQADLNAAIEARLARERETEKRRQAAEAEKAKAETAKEQGKWQELATQHETKAGELQAELDQLKPELDGLRALLAAQVEAGVKALPEELRELVPEDLPLAKRLDLLGKAQKAAEKGRPPAPGNGPNPRVADAAGKGKTDQTAREIQDQFTRRVL